jgi:murein DD-endopeptidase MepM/ murein hydrolase activator NlpD
VATFAVAVPADAASTTTAPEARQRQIDQQLSRLYDQIGEASEQQAKLIAELQVTRRDRQALDAKVAAIEAQMAVQQRDVDAVTAELASAVAADDAASAAVNDAKAQLDDATDAMRTQAIDSYIHYGDKPSAASILNDLDNVNDAPRVEAYLRLASRRHAEVIDEHRKVKQDLAVLEKAASDAKAEVAARQADVVAKQDALQGARDDQATARAQVAAEADREQRLLAQVQSQKSAYLQQVNELERESNQIAFDLSRRQSGQTPPPARKGALSYPVANPVITSTFGYRIHPIYGDRRLHTGVDFAANVGTPVLAAATGTVVFAGWMSGYGNAVVIDHGGALATLYAHNSALLVSVGQLVKRGQRISSAGSTGNSTGPHLHFEVRVKGTPVDPMSYL